MCRQYTVGGSEHQQDHEDPHHRLPPVLRGDHQDPPGAPLHRTRRGTR